MNKGKRIQETWDMYTELTDILNSIQEVGHSVEGRLYIGADEVLKESVFGMWTVKHKDDGNGYNPYAAQSLFKYVEQLKSDWKSGEYYSDQAYREFWDYEGWIREICHPGGVRTYNVTITDTDQVAIPGTQLNNVVSVENAVSIADIMLELLTNKP